LWVIDKSTAAPDQYRTLLGVPSSRSYTGENAVESFVNDLVAAQVADDARVADCCSFPGPVQIAIRIVASPGQTFAADMVHGPVSDDLQHFLDDTRSSPFSEAFPALCPASCRVVRLDDVGMTVEIGGGRIPVFISWRSLEAIPELLDTPTPPIMRSGYGDHTSFAQVGDKAGICVSIPLLPLLLAAGVLEPVFQVNRWVVRPGPAIYPDRTPVRQEAHRVDG
jgi:hypothetical protein